MELFKKIIVILGSVLNFVGKIPAFLLPNALKGYRTELFNLLALGVAALDKFDIIGISDAICGIFNCDPKAIQMLFALIVTAGNVALRRTTDTPAHTS
ncbi:MAG: hypothetical protein ABI851_12220 [Saprospiraceae bacterium]